MKKQIAPATATTPITFTENENEFIQALVAELYAEPGFSDVDVKDMARSLRWTLPVTKGVLGSLVSKGVLFTQQTDTFGAPKYELIYLHEAHYNLHPKWSETAPAEVTVKASKKKAITTPEPEPAPTPAKVKAAKNKPATEAATAEPAEPTTSSNNTSFRKDMKQLGSKIRRIMRKAHLKVNVRIETSGEVVVTPAETVKGESLEKFKKIMEEKFADLNTEKAIADRKAGIVEKPVREKKVKEPKVKKEKVAKEKKEKKGKVKLERAPQLRETVLAELQENFTPENLAQLSARALAGKAENFPFGFVGDTYKKAAAGKTAEENAEIVADAFYGPFLTAEEAAAQIAEAAKQGEEA